jgi:hypothetical protein
MIFSDWFIIAKLHMGMPDVNKRRRKETGVDINPFMA